MHTLEVRTDTPVDEEIGMKEKNAKYFWKSESRVDVLKKYEMKQKLWNDDKEAITTIILIQNYYTISGY